MTDRILMWEEHHGYQMLLLNKDRAKEFYEKEAKDEIESQEEFFKENASMEPDSPIYRYWAPTAAYILECLAKVRLDPSPENYIELMIAYGQSDFSDEGFHFIGDNVTIYD